MSTNVLDLRDGGSNLLFRVDNSTSPSNYFEFLGGVIATNGTASQILYDGSAASGQSADVLRLRSYSGSTLFEVTSSGATTTASAATFNGGLTTGLSTNSNLYIGTGNLGVGPTGHFFLQTQSLIRSILHFRPYTAGGNDGYMYFDTSGTNTLVLCSAGSRYHVTLTSF